MKIIPLADRVVIKTVEVEETTKGGLILTGSAKEKPQVAQVVAVGPGGVVDGKEVKMTVKVGDKVKRGQTLCIVEAMKADERDHGGSGWGDRGDLRGQRPGSGLRQPPLPHSGTVRRCAHESR